MTVIFFKTLHDKKILLLYYDEMLCIFGEFFLSYFFSLWNMLYSKKTIFLKEHAQKNNFTKLVNWKVILNWSIESKRQRNQTQSSHWAIWIKNCKKLSNEISNVSDHWPLPVSQGIKLFLKQRNYVPQLILRYTYIFCFSIWIIYTDKG